MSQWKKDTPPLWAPNAKATPAGWADPVTGELLVATRYLQQQPQQESEQAQQQQTSKKKVVAAPVKEQQQQAVEEPAPAQQVAEAPVEKPAE